MRYFIITIFYFSCLTTPFAQDAIYMAPCPCTEDHMNFDSNFSTLGLYQAIQTITGSNTISSGSTTDFRAGNFILLDPEFEVEPGAEFSAEIEDCPNSSATPVVEQ